ncbi:hypothetical protein GCM10022288_16590 [Gryllotalpicola kribbensis]|uniref:Uncharacterized protein n=1 Tax=Gryllotalpicola kribbensis TaxID=993084 RepID=A0ABP8ASW5_9MICO
MSHNIISPAEELEYADVILELRERAKYEKQKHANEHWHQVAERVAHAFGAGDPDAGARGARSGFVAPPASIARPRG